MAVDVLVTGASGVLGRRIVSTLRSAEYRVVACSRKATDGADARWDISRQDAPEPDSEPAVVVHAAAIVGGFQQPLSEAMPLFDVNVNGTLRVARWCVSRRVKRLILVSGAIVYGEWTGRPKSETDEARPWIAGPYAVSKWCSEQVAALVKSAGIGLTILRLSSLYGVGYDNGLPQRFLRRGWQAGSIPLAPPFDDAFDLLPVSVAARTVQRAVEKDRSGLWNVGSGTLTTIRELAETCARETNAGVTDLEPESDRHARILNWVDDRKARRYLGHVANISLESGISEIADSLQQSPGFATQVRAARSDVF